MRSWVRDRICELLLCADNLCAGRKITGLKVKIWLAIAKKHVGMCSIILLFQVRNREYKKWLLANGEGLSMHFERTRFSKRSWEVTFLKIKFFWCNCICKCSSFLFYTNQTKCVRQQTFALGMLGLEFSM